MKQQRIAVVLVLTVLVLLVSLFIVPSQSLWLVSLFGIVLCIALFVLLIQAIQRTPLLNIKEQRNVSSNQIIERALRMLAGGGISILLIPFMLIILRDVFSISREGALLITYFITIAFTLALAFYSERMYRRA